MLNVGAAQGSHRVPYITKLSRRFNRRVASIQLIQIIKIRFLQTWSKSGFGSMLVQFWLRIRILHEKLHLVIGSDPFYMDF